MSSDLSSIESQFNINSSKSNNDEIYEFESFRLDAAHLMLYQDGKEISLAPKVVETLVALIERRGEIISKKELINRLWADSFVEDSNLTQNIYLLRKTLGEAADSKPLIETFRRRGYRFTGKLKNFSAAEPEISSNEKNHRLEPSRQTSPGKHKPRWSWWYPVAALGVLIVAVFGLTRFNWREKSAAQNPGAANVSLKRLTPNLTTFNPAISPDGGFIAYAKLEESGMTSLWLKNIRTGGAREILPPLVKGYLGLQFSPDGKEIYYLSYKMESAKHILMAVDSESGATREVIENISVWFAISPDGKQAAFVRATDLIVADTSGKKERAVSRRDGKSKWFASQNARPAWSPDGRRIVVSGGYLDNDVKRSELVEVSVGDGIEKRIQTPPWDKIGSVAWRNDDAGLYVIARQEPNQPTQIFYLSPLYSGEARRVTGDLHNYNSLSLTADSRFLVTEQVAGKSDIWIAEKDDPAQIKKITFDDEENTGVNGLAFMPDGRIVYTTIRSGNMDLWVMNADGSDQKQLTSNMGGWNMRPRPTSDGRYIVFQSFNNNQNHIWRMDADGRNVIQLTNGNEANSSPDVSPDGRWVYYTSAIGDNTSVWKISINGGTPVRVTDDNKAVSPAVSPDGKMIAVHHDWDQTASFKVGILSAETGKLLKTFDLAVFRRVLRWTHDSQSLVYIQKKSPNLWQQPFNSGQPRQLTNFNLEKTWNFAFSPDERQVAFVRGNINTESVLISDLLK